MDSAYTDDPFRVEQSDVHDGRDRPGGENGRDADVSGWFERTPAGWRPRVDDGHAAEKAARIPHVQALNMEQAERALMPRGFQSCQFVGYLKNEAKFARNGDMIITIQVPYEYKGLAFALTDAFGIPLSMDFQVWQPYDQDVQQGGA